MRKDKTQLETKEVEILVNTHLKASSPSACSAVLLILRAVNKKQGAIFLSNRKKTSSEFNATNACKYVNQKQMFGDLNSYENSPVNH